MSSGGLVYLEVELAQFCAFLRRFETDKAHGMVTDIFPWTKPCQRGGKRQNVV
jgi:hypothetical protein